MIGIRTRAGAAIVCPMALFQKAPSTPEEAERWKPLATGPDEVLELSEEEWYAKVYRGAEAPQLTIRAVLMGSVLGFFLAFTNLYIGLMTGWALGVAITASILSFTIWGAMLRAGVVRSPMTILETNCMQSTASSAGYATGGTMVSAIAALLMLDGQHLPWPVLVLWTLFLGFLGTLLAIPMKRNMINRERLKFPTGTAAAETLQSLYSEGASAVRKAKALLWVALAGAVWKPFISLEVLSAKVADASGEMVDRAHRSLLAAESAVFNVFPAFGTNAAGERLKPSDWLLYFDHDPVMIAAGALVGLRIAVSMIIGSLLLAFWIGPASLIDGWTNADGVLVFAASAPGKAWKEIGVWSGTPILIASGLLAFAMQWRTIARAFSGMASFGNGGEDKAEELVSQTEVPFRWFAGGVAVFGAAVIILSHSYFGIPWHFGLVAVLLTFILSLVACRATGESDITPVGAMGKITQLTFGFLMPQSATANLMTASITSSASGSAADLLTDLKSGYLLGANPRRQFMAQFLGVISGTAATVIGFYLLVPDAETLTGGESGQAKFPAVAAQAWLAVAELFKRGLENMHPTHVKAIWWGLGVGAILQLLDTFLPKWKKWIPSATGLGLGLILPFQYPFAMLIGALAAWAWARANKDSAEEFVVPVAAGLIAGISIMGVIVALLNNIVFA